MKTKNMTMKKIAAIAALALALVPVALAGLAGYSFTPIAFLDNPAPGGANFTFDFEPSAINNRGEVGFTADVTTGGEGVFVGLRGELTQIMRSGQPAPGGGVFGPNEFGRLGVNEGGDIAIPFSLEPLDFSSMALNAGIFRFSNSTQTLNRVAGPGTPVPGGAILAGNLFFTTIYNREDNGMSDILKRACIEHLSSPGVMGLCEVLMLS